jgi:PKD repeat protein
VTSVLVLEVLDMARTTGRMSRRRRAPRQRRSVLSAAILATLLLSLLANLTRAAEGDTFTIVTGGNLDWQPQSGGLSRTSTERLTTTGTLTGVIGTAPYELSSEPGAVRARMRGSHENASLFTIPFNPQLRARQSIQALISGPVPAGTRVDPRLRLHVDGTMRSTPCGTACTMVVEILASGRGAEWKTVVDLGGTQENGLGLTIDAVSQGFRIHGDIATPTFLAFTETPFQIDLQVRFATTALTGAPVTFDIDFRDGLTFAPTGPVLELPAGFDVSATGIVDDEWQGGRPTGAFTATPSTVDCGQAVTFDGSASQAAGVGAIEAYRWSFGDGATATTDAPTVDHAYATSGTFQPGLVVVDGNGAVSDPVSVTTRSIDRTAPVAAITGPAVTDPFADPGFDGTGSADPGGTCGSGIVEYRWRLDGGTPLATTSPTVQLRQLVSEPAPGSHALQLVVVDGAGNASDDAVHKFEVAAVTAPVAKLLVSPTTVACGKPITLDGSASTSAPGTSIHEYRFDPGTGGGVISTTSASLTRPYDRLGRFTPTLVVVDDRATVSDPATGEVLVIDDGAPNAAIRPIIDRYAGTAMTFDGGPSTDPETGCGSRIVSWRWQLDGGTVVELPEPTTGSGSLTPKLSVGVHTLSLTVVDDSGNLSDPSSATFRVLRTPVAQLAADALLPSCGDTTHFDGSASTADAVVGIASFRWHFGDATGDVVTPQDSPTIDHVYAALGRYDATLVVTDANGTQSPADGVTVTLRDTRAPTAVPAVPSTVTDGALVTFDGSKSTDPDAACGSRVVAWRWQVDSGPVVETTAASISSAAFAAQLTPGAHTVRLTVLDDAGNTSEPASRTMSVAIAPGTVVLAVDTAPDTTVAIGLVGPAPFGTTTLDGSPTTATPDSRSFAGLTAGTYQIVQTATAKLGVVRIACIDPDGGTTVDVSGRLARLDVDGGETVACTFTSISLASVGSAATGLQSLAFTPAAATALLKGFAYTANQAGPAIASAYGIDAAQEAAHLKAAGYSSTDLTTALKNGFGQTAAAATSILKGIAYDANVVAARLTDTYGRTPQQVAQLLKDAQFSATEVTVALKTQLGQDAVQVATILRQAGYSAGVAYQQLRDRFALDEKSAAEKELTGGYSVQAIVQALKDVAGKSASEAALLMRLIAAGTVAVVAAIAAVYSFGASVEVQAATVAAAMAVAGWTTAEVTQGLKAGIGASAAITMAALQAAEVAAGVAMQDVAAAYTRTPQQVAQLAKDAQYTQAQISIGLRDELAQGRQQVAGIFRQIGYSAGTTLTRLQTDFGASLQLATETLLGAQYQVQAVVAALKDTAGRSASQAAAIVRLAQVAPTAAAAAIAAVFTVGMGAQVAATTVAAAMLAGGYAAAEVTLALKMGMAASAAITTAALYAANVGIPTVIAQVTTTFGRSLQQVIGYLHDAGASEAELAAHLHDAESRQLAEVASMLRLAGAGANAVYAALRDEFTADREALAEALDDGGFANQAIATALKVVGGADIGETARIMRTVVLASAGACATVLLVAYAPAEAAAAATIAIALAGAGYTSAQVAGALKTAVVVGAEAGAIAMQAAGYGASTVAAVLKSTWSVGAETAADILHDALDATSTEIAKAMKEQYSRSGTETAQILADLGYSATTVAKRLDDVFGKGAASAAGILKAVGYGSTDISEAMRDAYDRTATQTATILRDLGYSLETIVRRLDDVFDKGVDSIQSILTGLGFSLADVLAAITAVFG